MTAIAARDLSKTFTRGSALTRLMVRGNRRASLTALNGLTFDVDRGEVVALTGANGSGKSTLLRVLATLLLPTSGSADVDGHDVVVEGTAVRQRVSFVPADDRSFTLTLTGRGNLEFFATVHGIPRSRLRPTVVRALEEVGLTNAADDNYASYSSGMRQRLALARAIAADARVLLLDEPFRALDDAAREGLRTAIAQRAAAGTTVLAATHALDELDGVWTRVLHLEHGVLTGNTKIPVPR